MGTKVLVADDHGIIRQGLRSYLENQLSMEVVAEVESGRVIMGYVRKFSPDIIIMDVTIPDLDGMVITKRILAEFPNTKIIALSVNSYPDFIRNLFDVGICAYVLKETLFEELTTVMNNVSQGKTYLSSSIKSVSIESLL